MGEIITPSAAHGFPSFLNQAYTSYIEQLGKRQALYSTREYTQGRST